MAHTSVANFDGVLIQDLVEGVVGGEMFINHSLELCTYISFHVSRVGYLSFSIFLATVSLRFCFIF